MSPQAQEPEVHSAEAPQPSPNLFPPAAPNGISTNAPVVQEVSPGIYRIGKVQLDKHARSVSFPAIMNFEEGLIEYVLVTTYGKTHESLLRTEARPSHIHLAMLLLGARGAGTNTFPKVSTDPLPGDPVSVEVSWYKDRVQHSTRVERWVLDRHRQAAMPETVWVYNGSRLFNGMFLAETDGSIISLITDESALINNPWPLRDDDENWQVSKAPKPPLETPVTVTIKLLERKGSAPRKAKPVPKTATH